AVGAQRGHAVVLRIDAEQREARACGGGLRQVSLRRLQLPHQHRAHALTARENQRQDQVLAAQLAELEELAGVSGPTRAQVEDRAGWYRQLLSDRVAGA